jgi:fructokinase
MKPVICFGEALIDFMNVSKYKSDIRADSYISINDYRQFPGGAPANAAVAVAKLGGKSYFSGQVGQDTFGDFLEQSLEHYQVDTQFLLRHASAKTALAFVSLDEEGERSFSFYRDMSADVLLTPTELQPTFFAIKKLAQPYIFHFCSNTLTTPDIAQTTLFAVKEARKQDAMISFDVNLRHNLWQTERANIDLVNQFVAQANVLKFSLEELTYLSKGQEQEYISQCLNQQASLVLVTDGANDISYYTASRSGSVYPPTVKAVDTTAGGDAFVGGLLFGLSQCDFTEKGLISLVNNEQYFLNLLQFACACGAYTVAKEGAFPALPNLEQVTDLLLTVNQNNAANLFTVQNTQTEDEA